VNPALAGIAPSIIRALNARKRPGDVDLGLGEPTLRPDARFFEAATAWVRANGCPYTPNAGFADLRAAVAAYHGFPDRGAAENVCITVGSEEAIYLALKAVLDPARDEVLVVEPCYLAYPKLCALEGIPCRTVGLDPAGGFRPDAARVLDALGPRTRMIVLCSPANPTGRVWPEAELAALAAGLAARPGPPVWVLSDEVYRELYYTPAPPASIGTLWPHALVAGSLSKSNALTGLRLGWLVGPAGEVAAATKVHQLVNTAASTFSQVVARELFADPANLAAHRPLYAARLAEMSGWMAESGVEWIAPEGAFYCMVRLPPRLAGDSLAAAGALLERHRVVATPGVAFGAAGEGWLRLSWVAEAEALREGIGRIAAFFADEG
jgi:aspartate/methionine/tyrosine aminotransferase